MVISAIGVMPDTNFIKDSGIKLGERGHIVVNDHMETNIEGIYAGGDAVVVKDYVNGNEAFIPLAGPANKHGRIIADNIAGLDKVYKGSLGTSIIKVFDMVAASAGNNERTLNRYGIKYDKVYLYPMSHAGYYPNAIPLNIKVIYDKEGKILGAQVLGYEGVDKFIDVIATSIKFGGRMEDLAELDLVYAPPFLSAKSPANMAGFMAENQRNGLVKNATGLSCPGPLMQVKMTMDTMFDGEVLKVRASDPGFYRDIEAWTNKTNNRLINIEKNKGIIEATIIKCSNQLLSKDEMKNKMAKDFTKAAQLVPVIDGQTMVVFSGDLDKAIASFIIANGVEVVACTMSMGVMGIKKEELIDGVTYAGVGYYLGQADDSNINLFI